jgi:catechol 2,3-dioxygenase-like lactoylglutathione lyase family enzyme
MVMLGVSDINRSLPFYEGKLGMTVKQRFEGFAFFETGAVMLILSEALATNSPNVAGAMEIIFNVDDVTSHHQRLSEQEIEFINPPHQVSGPMWAANFRDPDGHLLTIFGPERKAP